MSEVKSFLKLYFVVGSINCHDNPQWVVEEAIKGGVTMLQFREKGIGSLQGSEKKELALKLKEICHKNHIPFIVNDDIQLALEIDADGVHIGQEDEPIEIVRNKIGSKLLGVSAHDYLEALEAVKLGANYLGVGPMFPTTTKTDIRQVKGPQVIQELRHKGISIPIVGIGGITSDNCHQVIHAGSDGIAVISAISHAPLPKEAAKILGVKIDNSLKTYN